jgi:hypothetical protein
MRPMISVLFFMFMVLPSQHAIAGDRTVAGFEKIRALVGEWEATQPDGKLMRVTYEEINGGAIEERYRSEDPMWWNMSTVYYLDNDRIIMAHYCSWGNHPRMTATVPEGRIDTLDFRFLDMARTRPDNGYMKHASIQFGDKDHFSHRWVWDDKDGEKPLLLTLVRKKTAAVTEGGLKTANKD